MQTRFVAHCLSRRKRYNLYSAFLFALAFLICSSSTYAQAPAPAGSGLGSQSNAGSYRGWTLGTRFEGSSSDDGTILDVATSVGYNFSRHLGVDLGVPFYFAGTPYTVKLMNPQAVSGSGIGDIGADLKLLLPMKTLNYTSTIHLGMPTGDTTKGFGTGHTTWSWSNHIEHGWGNFSPFIEVGIANSVQETHDFRRPFRTYGYTAQFEAGTELDVGPLSLSASAYDVSPWGTQTVISRVFRCPSGTKCSPGGKTTDRKAYLLSNVSSGDAALARDNGFNAGVEFKPVPYLDLELDYSRSVPLKLNSISFGIAVDLRGLMRSRSSRNLSLLLPPPL